MNSITKTIPGGCVCLATVRVVVMSIISFSDDSKREVTAGEFTSLQAATACVQIWPWRAVALDISALDASKSGSFR
jgi:hypothetical protein